MKKDKFRNIFILFFMLLSLFVLRNVYADSGWDSSYDSGGSSSSSSSWDSSSYDWDYGSSSHDDESSSSDSPKGSVLEGVICFTIFIVVNIVIFKGLVVSNKNLNNKSNSSIYHDISLETLNEILPDETIENLKKIVYHKFIEIQEAWMNFDYDKLRELCTDELYNSYVSQLEVLKLKNGQNIMKYFTLENIKILDVRVDNEVIIVNVYMRIKFYDYVIDKKTNRAIRGSKNKRICNNYEMEFVRKQNIENMRCPNCGAPITHNTSGECEYCGSTIVKSADDFVLSKKTNVNKE